MSDDNTTYPYTLTILPSGKRARHFDWAIRKHGKLLAALDWLDPSERAARDNGEAALDRLIRDEREPTLFPT